MRLPGKVFKKCKEIVKESTTPELFDHERSFQMADNESMIHAKLNHFVGLFAPLKSGNYCTILRAIKFGGVWYYGSKHRVQ